MVNLSIVKKERKMGKEIWRFGTQLMKNCHSLNPLHHPFIYSRKGENIATVCWFLTGQCAAFFVNNVLQW